MGPLLDVMLTPTAAAIVAALVGLVYVIYKIWPAARRFGHFLDDWAGEPARGPVPARPGVLERLHTIETDMASVRGDVCQLKTDVAELREETAR